MTGEDSMREKSRIRAVFSDVDGTLLNSAHRVTPRTAEWIRKLGEMDIPFEEYIEALRRLKEEKLFDEESE